MAVASLGQLVSLREWETAFLPGLHLTPGEARLADYLRSGTEAHLHVEPLRDGTRVTAESWAGVVHFEQFQVRVTPKLTGGALGLVDMIEFAAGLDSLRRLPAERLLSTESAGLFDLIALLFLETCDALIRSGLFRDYREQEEELGVVRGRLLIDQQVVRRFGRLDRLICRFDEQEYDVLENRIIVAALGPCARYATHESVRRRAHLMNALFRQLCDPEALDPASAQQDLHYNRLNEHYREAHTLAFLILNGLGIDDVLAHGSTPSFAFLIDMNDLFERFVLRLIEYALPAAEYSVRYQRSDRSILWNADTNRPYAKVVPDILVIPRPSRQIQLAIDAKYKLYDETKVASSDVYQAFLYAYAFSAGRAVGLPRAFLVYPSSSESAAWLRLQVRDSARMPAAEILALGISIPDALKEIRLGQRGPVTNALAEGISRAIGGGGDKR
jgi:5-methylcytosine-specific restriction enzyme subunit McrC